MYKLLFACIVVMLVVLVASYPSLSQSSPNISFFITSAGSGNGANLGGLAGADAICQRLAAAGVKDVGIQPKGKRPWSVAEAVREQIRSERGRTEGVMGTLKSNRYRFNKPKERLWHTLEMAGPRSILSFNLSKLMRDVVALTR